MATSEHFDRFPIFKEDESTPSTNASSVGNWVNELGLFFHYLLKGLRSNPVHKNYGVTNMQKPLLNLKTEPPYDNHPNISFAVLTTRAKAKSYLEEVVAAVVVMLVTEAEAEAEEEEEEEEKVEDDDEEEEGEEEDEGEEEEEEEEKSSYTSTSVSANCRTSAEPTA
ncbi:unnamed protein product [Hydatigera taeniaeformis]|uniref:Uncharacterized protein n=1 Tax=Hydatigena taeniaeformis TaxID=6205 RepID=A0A0R3X935_HYDTA|nr:unnamed protein product [Hydatigera taeniaeformis]